MSSTMEKQLPDFDEIELKRSYSIAIVGTKWNNDMVSAMINDAILVIDAYTSLSYRTFEVAGTIELAHAAHELTSKYDAVILFGVVIRGETPHFDYVCDTISRAVAILNTSSHQPTIFGVLTVENTQQAIDRISGPIEYKGKDAANSAITQLKFIEDTQN